MRQKPTKVEVEVARERLAFSHRESWHLLTRNPGSPLFQCVGDARPLFKRECFSASLQINFSLA